MNSHMYKSSMKDKNPSQVANVQSKMMMLRNHPVLLDRDVAVLYGVETKALNQAVKRNIERFPEGYIITLTQDECSRSQIVTLNGGRGSNIKYLPHAFTERGLYMLATILKSERAVKASIAIVEAYAKLRSMVRNMEELQTKKSGSPEQLDMLSKIGKEFVELIGDNLTTKTVETEIELNLSVIKIRHKITRTKKA